MRVPHVSDYMWWLRRSNDVSPREPVIKTKFPPRLCQQLHPSSPPTTSESMARRSAAPNSGPAYYSRSAVTGRPGIQDLDDVETSAISRFMNEEIWAPEKLLGNIAVVTSVGVFAAGIFFVRKFGDLIIP